MMKAYKNEGKVWWKSKFFNGNVQNRQIINLIGLYMSSEYLADKYYYFLAKHKPMVINNVPYVNQPTTVYGQPIQQYFLPMAST